MFILALVIGFLYGNVSVKGQFCMNSGFSNVFRRKDTTKLKSFITAILVQILILPLLFTGMYFHESSNHLIENIGMPPLFFIGSIIGGFFFGIFMHFAAGCGAGIFYKIGEKNAGAAVSAVGFIAGIGFAEKGVLRFMKEVSQRTASIEQEVFWKGDAPLAIAIFATIVSGVILLLLFKGENNKPRGAEWGWKNTGIGIGIIGVVGWISAIMVNNPFGMAIIPGAMDIVDLNYSWGLLFVLGIPFGAFWSTRNNKEKQFVLPTTNIIGKRLFGGLGLGVSGSIAAGCTVGHGLTFLPLLGVGSMVATLFIFLGSGMIGYLTRE